MTSEPGSIDPELSALRAELETTPNDSARNRVFSRLEASIPALAGLSAATLATSNVVPRGAPSRVARLAAPAKLWLLGAFVLGGAVGGASYALLRTEPEPRVVFVDRPLPDRPANGSESPATAPPGTVPTPAPTEFAPATKPLLTARSAPARPKPELTPASPEPAPSPPERLVEAASLAEQQALLDQARAALGKGDGRGALETLRVHTGRFPESVFAEEREALAIKALASVGRDAEARARLGSFEKQFPRSPLLPSLRMATGAPVTETKR